MRKATKRAYAHKVRCVVDHAKGVKAWIFYLPDDERAYLAKSKLLAENDGFTAEALLGMSGGENRELRPPAYLKLVKGRKQWLVHRIDDGQGIVSSAKSVSPRKLL